MTRIVHTARAAAYHLLHLTQTMIWKERLLASSMSERSRYISPRSYVRAFYGAAGSVGLCTTDHNGHSRAWRLLHSSLLLRWELSPSHIVHNLPLLPYVIAC